MIRAATRRRTATLGFGFGGGGGGGGAAMSVRGAVGEPRRRGGGCAAPAASLPVVVALRWAFAWALGLAQESPCKALVPLAWFCCRFRSCFLCAHFSVLRALFFVLCGGAGLCCPHDLRLWSAVVACWTHESRVAAEVLPQCCLLFVSDAVLSCCAPGDGAMCVVELCCGRCVYVNLRAVG